MRPRDIVGSAEAAEILNTNKPQITRWIDAGKMPPPAVETPASTIWHRKDVEAMRDGKPWRNGKPLDLVGLHQAAEILVELRGSNIDSEKRAIARWRADGRFPKAFATPERGGPVSGPLWWREDVEEFARDLVSVTA